MKLQRKDKIIKLLTENHIMKANEMAKIFGVSMETIRRDMSELETEGVIRRVHGGAILNTAYNLEPDYSNREMSQFEEKLLIGKKAVSMVADGDTIIIDIGTTTLEFAKMLKGKKKVTVITNSLLIALALLNDPDIHVIMLGGNIRMGEGTASGFWAEEMVDQFYVDKLFLGAGAVSAEHGIMDFNTTETNLRRHFIRHAKQTIALADYTKLGIKALNIVCGFSELDYLITDEQADKKMLKLIREQGVEVITV